jgi:hypothetical protein
MEGNTTLHDIINNHSYTLEHLEITVKKCCTINNKSSYALINVYNNKLKKEIFKGWMMSTLTSKNPLEDPKFDLILLNC